MGCAGSKPHLLLSSNNHASNSPQKGFILFNANTIEYLKENEVDVKAKLIQRCENKLLKTNSSSSASSKSLLGNAKKSLFSSNNNSNANANNDNNNKTDLPTSGTATTTTTNNDAKSKSIDSAVDYVLKYAINDFDIEDFKSSNHLSMKQIRKDIMKKYNNRTSFSRLNNSTNNGTLSMNGTLGSKDNTLTLSRTSSNELAFYKLALNTAIDEFGSYVQENFIVISEFKPKVKDSSEEENKDEKQTEGDNESALTAEEEALKLKEALELARQNFYKGKVSMVCLTKTGGYVVKEVKDQTSDNLAQIVNEHNQEVLPDLKVNVESNSVHESVSAENKLVTPQINVEDMDKTLNASINSAQQQEALNEYLQVKNDLPHVLNDTIELIANYTAKGGTFENDQIEFTDKLADRLSKSKQAIDKLKSINENDYALVDEKLVEAIINLDYVNRDFKTFIGLLVDQLKSKPESSTDNELIVKNEAIKQYANELDSLTSQLSVKLFSTKNLPHPNEANKSEISLVKEETNVEVKSRAESPKPSSPATNESEKAKVEQTKLSPSKNIDIKKEIAFSILNVGEVLAKTIDYYSLDTNNEQDEELKELINMSKKQASLEKKQADGDKEEKFQNENVISKQQLLQVNTDLKKSEDDKTASNSRTAESYTSSLSSPSISSSPLSGSGSISPAEPKERTYESSATTMPASVVLAQNTTQTATNGANSFVNEQQVDNEINFLINEINENASRKENLIQTSNSSTGFDDNHQHYGKSSSSSSDILSNSQNDLLKAESETTNVQQFLNDIIIESATQNESNVVYRNGTTAPQQASTNETGKRMSLDEEFFYQIEEVDKKVKYMNETCSENEGDDDDDLDDENFDYDESVELENTNDERLFHPRTPAKIKSELRKNRTIDLHEEIKQISNVIQDLVQTINVRNNNSTSNTNVNTSNGTETEPEVVLNADEHNSESFDINFVVNQIKNETNERKNLNDSHDTPKSKKANSNANTSLSNIPVRQRVLTKQKATSIEDEHQQQQSIELSNSETFKSVVNFESFVDFSSNQSTPESNSLNNSKNRSSKFRSKLPVKK